MVTTNEAFNRICRRFLETDVIGVDLEADSMHCFREKVCLIQLSGPTGCYIVDPLAVSDFSVFGQLLASRSVLKVFHGSDFDIRSLDRDFNIRVNPLFDTEIACRFLGIQQRGLAALLDAFFDVKTDKKYQRYDWGKRPLAQEMIRYSRTDVAYLIDLFRLLARKLEEKGRQDWASEEFGFQAAVRYEDNHEPPLFRKFKGAGKMDSRSLAVLENLLMLRLRIAEKKDVPLFKVFSNQSIMDMVREKPATPGAVKRTGALSKKQLGMYADFCAEAVSAALTLSAEQLPVYPRGGRHRLTRTEQEKITALKQMREKKSCDLGIEPGFLLNNSMITSLAADPEVTMDTLRKTTGIRQWQIRAIGPDIVQALAPWS